MFFKNEKTLIRIETDKVVTLRSSSIAADLLLKEFSDTLYIPHSLSSIQPRTTLKKCRSSLSSRVWCINLKWIEIPLTVIGQVPLSLYSPCSLVSFGRKWVTRRTQYVTSCARLLTSVKERTGILSDVNCCGNIGCPETKYTVKFNLFFLYMHALPGFAKVWRAYSSLYV